MFGHMRRALWIPLLLPLALLTGCDPIYGVRRRARVSFMPEPARIGAVVRATPGVEKVAHSVTEGGRPVTFTGIHRPEQVHTFIYDGGTNVHGVLQFSVDYRERVEYSQTLLRMFTPPPQEWVDATRSVMVQIEAQLEATCGLTNLRKTVVEHCTGVTCK